ncbi:MAG: hypothetical protein ABI723_15985 [Bacteroidia bacterium]
MKKITATLLVVIYLIPAIGLSVNTHHCGGMLAAIHLVFLSDKHKCGCGKKAMKKDCCKDKVQQFKISDKHFASSIGTVKVMPQPEALIHISINSSFPIYQPQELIAFHPHAPPDSPPGVLYITHCSFLI